VIVDREIAIVKTATVGRNIREEAVIVLEETPDGWISGYPHSHSVGIALDTMVGYWYSPSNIVQRNVMPYGDTKFDYNEIPPGTLVTIGQGSHKVFGLVIERKGAKYEVMLGDEKKKFDWQRIRPFNAAIDNVP
jgi:hypothetical protein